MTIQHKRSSVAGKAPTTAQLALGELAVNTADGKIFLKKSANGIESVVDLGLTVEGTSNVGDYLMTYKTPDLTKYLPVDGAVYARSSFPELATKLGYLNGGFGTTWGAVTSAASEAKIVRVNPFDGKMYVLTLTGELRVREPGQAIKQAVTLLHTGGPTHSSFTRMVFIKNTIIVFAPNQNSFYRTSKNADGTWTPWVSFSVTMHSSSTGFCESPDRLLLTGQNSSGYETCFTTTDGVTWNYNYSSGGLSDYHVNIVWTGTYFVTQELSNFKYSSNGTLWYTGTPSSNVSRIVTNGQGTLVSIGIFDDMYVSTNHGVTWTRLAYGTYPKGDQPGGSGWKMLGYVNDQDPSFIYVVGTVDTVQRMYKSTNGFDWLEIWAGNPGEANSLNDWNGQYLFEGLPYKDLAPTYSFLYQAVRPYDFATQFSTPKLKNPKAIPEGAKLYVRAKPNA